MSGAARPGVSVSSSELPRRRRHDRLPRGLADARLARRRSRSSSSTTRRATAAPSASARPRPGRHGRSTRRRTPGSPAAATSASRHATGEYVAFLNNDARPDPDWLTRRGRRARRTTRSSRASPARCSTGTARPIDFVDGALTVLRHGLQAARRRARRSAPRRRERDVLFAPARRWSMRRRACSSELGGFDERYFMFFEDVDLGWRLWLLGYRVRYVPDSLVYHRHHAIDDEVRHLARALPARAQRAVHDLQELRRRATCAPVLPAALMLAVRRAVALGGDDPHVLDLQRSTRRRRRPPIEVAQADAGRAVRHRLLRRAAPTSCRAARTRAPGHAARAATTRSCRLFRQPLRAEHRRSASFLEAFDTARRGVRTSSSVPGAAAHPRRHRRHARPSDGRARRSAPGTSPRRCRREHDVELVIDDRCRCELRSPTSGSGTGRRRGAAPSWSSWCDVIIFQGYLMHELPVARGTDKVIVADIYDPIHLEQLEQARDLGSSGRRTSSTGHRPRCSTSSWRAATSSCARARQAARLLARPARRASAASTRSPTTTTRRSTTLHRRRARSASATTPPRAHAHGAQGRRARHRRRRQGHPLGRRRSTTGSTR